MTTRNDDNELLDIPETLQPRCQRVYGWEPAFADRAVQAYRQWIKLKLQLEDWDATILSPSPTIDQVWHQHILHVQQYMAACAKYTGRPRGHVIGHNPDGGLDVEARQERIKTTKLALKSAFGRNVDDEVWSFCDPRRVPVDRVDLERDGTDNQHKPDKRPRAEVGGAVPSKEEGTIEIIICDHKGNQALFRVKKSTRMRKIFNAYVKRLEEQQETKIDVHSLRFLDEAGRIDDNKTVEEAELFAGDKIDVKPEQTGC